MPRTNRPPTYRLHKARNCAVVTINGENRYLGPYGSPESHEKYARLIAQWQANGKDLAAIVDSPDAGAISVNGLILRYLGFAANYYVKHGTPTGEVNNILPKRSESQNSATMASNVAKQRLGVT